MTPLSPKPGPASIELAVRAAYPLVVSGRLNADRGTAHNDQPDPRTPGEVLDAMRRTVLGVRQLAQAIRDFAEGRHIRVVDTDGVVCKLADGSGDQLVTDVFLRDELPIEADHRTPHPHPEVRHLVAATIAAQVIEESNPKFETTWRNARLQALTDLANAWSLLHIPGGLLWLIETDSKFVADRTHSLIDALPRLYKKLRHWDLRQELMKKTSRLAIPDAP